MTHLARTREGLSVDASAIALPDWEALKLRSQLGDFVMTCCQAPAVLKTSSTGLPFFSHLSDECATAPETVWHQAGKAAVLSALRVLGIEGREEASGSTPAGQKWKADVLFATGGRSVAIELQRSAQTLCEFLARQERYRVSGVECYWLLRLEVYKPLSKAAARTVLKRLGGWPADGSGIGMGMLPELPAHLLHPGDSPQVLIGGGVTATVAGWLHAIVQGNYGHRNGTWLLDARRAE